MSIISADQSRLARRECGLSQADVEAGTGLKRQYISEFEAGTSNRFTRSQLRKLVDFYKAKIEEARAAGDEIDITFDDDEAASPAATIETVKAKRFHFPVDDSVSDNTLSSVLATIRTNDRKLADLLTLEAKRNDGLLGSGDFTEETLQTLRDAMSLLACNYLIVRAVSGWPEIGLTASNANVAGDQVLSVILASVQEQFEAAGLIGKADEKAADTAGKSKEGVQ